ncbi:MAG: biopolymer transporter ExbD [Planctomycetes bacterium]|nr:biopolymer transporter ExbD [Planctomycetota bacterium]
MTSKNRELAESTFALDMTPMIDCVFNLLIFFLCHINFKLLEGKIPAYLPKDVGANASPIDRLLEKVLIRVTRSAPPKLKDSNWTWHEDQIAIELQGRRQAGLAEFHSAILGLLKSSPDAKATLHPGEGTLYIDCVKVINECLRANFVDITLAGTPLDS